MIKTLKPGKLAGLRPRQIEISLSQHFGCEVEIDDRTVKIYCIEDYESTKRLDQHVKRLDTVGTHYYGCNKKGPFVGLVLNDEAIDIISGARAAREAQALLKKRSEMKVQ